MWVGTFSAKQSGRKVTTRSNGVDVDEMDLEFEGSVEQSYDSGNAYGLPAYIELWVVGNYSGRSYSAETYSSSGQCTSGGAWSTFIHRMDEVVASMESRYRINIQLAVDGTYEMFAGHMHSVESPFVPNQTYSQDFSRYVYCVGEARTEITQYRGESIFYGPVMPTATFQGTTNQLTGTISFPEPDGTPPTTTVFKWNLKRMSGLPQ
jgi:hypothetical protein